MTSLAHHARRLGKARRATVPAAQPSRFAWGTIATVVSTYTYTVYLDGVTTQGSDLIATAGSHLPDLTVGDVALLLILDAQVFVVTTLPQS